MSLSLKIYKVSAIQIDRRITPLPAGGKKPCTITKFRVNPVSSWRQCCLDTLLLSILDILSHVVKQHMRLPLVLDGYYRYVRARTGRFDRYPSSVSIDTSTGTSRVEAPFEVWHGSHLEV